MQKYEQIKSELKKRCNSVKYFTPDFYRDFLEDRKKSFKSFTAGNGWMKYEKTEKSDFYIKNSGTYCEFLSVYNDTLNKYRIDFFNGSFSAGYDHIERLYMSFETDEQCKQWASAYNKYTIYDINKVA